MSLNISPGPLPANNTRIKVAEVLTAFVNGTTITGFGLGDFADADFAMVYSNTDAPTDMLKNGILWFERGKGRMNQYLVRLEAADESNTTSEALWVKIADGRELVVRNLSSLPINSEPLWWSTDFSEYRTIIHPGGTAFSPVMDTTSDTNTNARTVLHDPVFISANTGVSDTSKGLTSHGFPTLAHEFGFCDARLVGNGPIVYLSSLFSDIDTYGAAVLIATTASLAGPTMTEVGVLAQSDSTDGLRSATIFLRPQLSNALHGDHTV